MDVKLIKLHRRRSGRVGGFVVQASRHAILLILFAIFFIGLFAGNIFVKSSESTYKAVAEVFKDFAVSTSGQTFFKTLFTQSLFNLLVLIITFVFGVCAIGFPFPIITMFMKGISIGALSSFLYAEYALKGFGFCMLIFYPVQILTCLVMLRAGKESFEMSIGILRYISGSKQKTGESMDFKLYLLRYLILLVLMTAISLISTILIVYIKPLFNF